MPTGYVSSDSNLEGQQLQVQELVIRFADLQLYSASGSVVTVNLQETIGAMVCVLHLDNSGPTCVLNAAASNVVSSASVAITLANAFATSDVLILKYIIA